MVLIIVLFKYVFYIFTRNAIQRHTNSRIQSDQQGSGILYQNS